MLKKKIVKWRDCGWGMETKVELYNAYERAHEGVHIGGIGSCLISSEYLLITDERCDIGKFCSWIQHNKDDFLRQGFPDGGYIVEKGYVF